MEIMEWMINTQLGRRNLPPQQRIAVVKKFEKKIQEQAKQNMSIGGSSDKKGSPNGETLIERKIRTDKELAKLANVGTGTIARFNRVMSSEDEKQQRIAVVKKFEKRIQERAIIKKKESDKNFHGNQYVVPSPNGEQSKPKIHTDKELAKLAGVGTGTIARFNRGLLLLRSIDRFMKDRHY